jgi:hypothetical protein
LKSAATRRLFRLVLVSSVVAASTCAAIRPADWIPIRWDMRNAGSLALLKGTPVNCLLLPWNKARAADSKPLLAEAHSAGISVLALFTAPGGDPEDVKAALASHVDGIVLEGDWPISQSTAIRKLVAPATPFIQLSARSAIHFDSEAPVIGTYQGVWPGIHLIDDSGSAEASATGSSWIYTNSGFLRAARALTTKPVWLSVRPPPNTALTTTQYLQAIADCEMMGAHWVITLDASFVASLENHVASALKRWSEIGRMLQFFKTNQLWQSYKPLSKLALIQGPQDGALLTGGVADMIGASHTPVRILPPDRLRSGSLAGTTVAINVNPRELNATQQKVLNDYTRDGGLVFTAPAAWNKIVSGSAGQIILDNNDAKQLGSAWQDLEQIIRKHLLGIRLFNVPAILFNLLESDDGRQAVLELTSYEDTPAENITIHLAGHWRTVELLQPGKSPQRLETYAVQEGTGIDINQLATFGVVKAEQ